MRVRPVLILIPVSLAVLAGLVSQRVAIADYFRSAAQPPLPESVSFEETRKGGQGDGEPASEPADLPPTIKTTPTPLPTPPTPAKPSELPSSFNLAVPFTSQAPFAIWDEVHEETCEEASLLMVDAFYDGRASFSPDWAEEQLLALVAFENKQFGYFEDTTAAQTATVASKFFGYADAEVVEDPTIESIKRELLAGHPVIVPAAGRELHNPYFKQPGPEYHMIVLRGWTEDGFIANDPGTRRGEGFVYDEATIMEAMDDWDPATQGLSGKKRVLVIEP